MSVDHRDQLSRIRTFPSLVKYLRDELDWPISQESFEDDEDLFFDFTPEELGLDSKTAAKIQEIRRLRPLSSKQPWGIFFVKFEPKKLPVVALRRLLGQVALKKRASANSAERAAWSADDLLFVSNYGEGDTRQISFAHFSQDEAKKDLPTLKVLGWDNLDTALHLDRVAELLNERLVWPEDEDNVAEWRRKWRSAFTLGHREVIDTSKKLSVELAVLARNIRDRINTVLAIETKDGPVSLLMAAFKEALVHDLDEDGFADMYAQTIAYGLLSARVADPSGDTADDFAGSMPLTSPFLKELMQTFLAVGGRNGKAGQGTGLDFDELGVNDVVELLDQANMEAVVRDFGDKNPLEDPVIHFYELFLKEYDAKKRTQRGVFYTPRPVVSLIVRSVDELLRTEFGLEDGLADTTTWAEMVQRHDNLEIPDGASSDQAFVQILDPATGTGTFLVEAINLIHKTMNDKWEGEGHRAKRIQQLWNEYVQKDLLPRLHGYELMMAPYAIAHMKIGLKLYETGYRFQNDERARVYLTNALEPPQDFSGTFAFAIPALAHEAEAVNHIKTERRFTAVIGNPPYSNKGMLNRNPWIQSLLEDYKRDLDEKKLNLDDDFIKFIRLSQAIIEGSGAGILGMITNNIFLDGLTHRRMRESILEAFDSLFVLNLHGDSRKQEAVPDGLLDKNVFDIQQGVAVCLFAKGPRLNAEVSCSDFWGSREDKMTRLSESTALNTPLIRLSPAAPHFFMVPKNLSAEEEYQGAWSTRDVFMTFGKGVKTERDKVSIHFSEKAIRNTVADFQTMDDASLRDKYALPRDSRDWKVLSAKDDVLKNDGDERYIRILYRPFDLRHTWYSGKTRGFIGTPGFPAMRHMLRPNLAMLLTRQVTSPPYNHCFVTRDPSEIKCASHDRASDVVPLFLYDDAALANETHGRPNFTREFLAALAKALGLPSADDSGLPEGITPYDVFFYSYSVFHSPCYRFRYAELLRLDFPRLPLPSGVAVFRALANLGAELVSVHLLESSAVTSAELKRVETLPIAVEAVSYSDGTVWIDRTKTIGFPGVSEDVWNFRIGGYQICNKWLKDRQAKGGKNPRPAHLLTDDDIAHYQKIIVAIGETIRIMAEIDEAIEAHGGWPSAFATDLAASEEESQQFALVAEPEQSYGD